MELNKEASWYTKRGDKKLRCDLCPHYCALDDGESGKCRVRTNRGGVLYSANYGRITSAAMDPIEKKPLYHFNPGSMILSLGTVGCNLFCAFCQNYEISQMDVPTSELSPADAVALAKREGSDGIAYTYNEPTIWFEYVLETSKLAREAGLYNVLVSNGFINPDPLRELLPVVDAVNMDIKSIRDDFYRKLCGGKVAPVLESAVTANESVHLEITNLVIPGDNDSDADLADLAEWISTNLGARTPVHLSAYRPAYNHNAPATGVEVLEKACGIFKKKLKYVYLGNVASRAGSDTACSECGSPLVERSGYMVELKNLAGDGTCSSCGADNNIKRRKNIKEDAD